MKSYDYAHRSGEKRFSWDDFAGLASRLAELLAPYNPRIILGVARAGLFPATIAACSLRRELYPIRLTRRVNDKNLYDRPVWRVTVPYEVAGKTVVVVDEIADTGLTLAMAAESALELGADRIITACLVAHSWANPAPQVSVLTSDEFIIFPWDEHIYVDGKWITNPEIEAGLKAQSQTDVD
jgi:hypoxanthine phosphoribosyltransferase